MKYTIIFLVAFSLLVLKQGKAQFDLQVYECTDSAMVVALVDSVLLSNVEPEFKKNITFTGDPESVGYFWDAYVLGFAEARGIALSTGFAGDLDQSNDCQSQNASGNTNGASDVDLSQMTSLSINDACIIEFDVMLFNDSIFLSYVFGSEEYHDYVNSSFNDVFGFLLSGPEINGPYSNNAINISVVPGTNEPVKISSVNCGNQQNGCEPPPGDGTNCEFLVDNKDQTQPAFDQFVLDGYTVPFETHQGIQSYEWYHVKLAIGDAGDAMFDSGVFLEKGSIVSIPVPDINIAEAENENEVIDYIDSFLLGEVHETNKANISFSGDPKAIGFFENTSFLGLEQTDGMIFTSGYASNATWLNECETSSNLSTDNNGLESDSDLEMLTVNGTVGDVSIVEFDFRPTNDSINFNYVFASEEYHDLVQTADFDVFGIFLSGPGIEGEYANNAVNLAILPEDKYPVNSSTISYGVGGLTCDGIPSGCINCELLVDNSQKTDTAFFALGYDGYTIPLNASYPVTPGDWYHIKIAIADGETDFDDSGIFLSNGTLVSDSLMTSVHNQRIEEQIVIKPNPAKEYIEIQSIDKEKVLSYSIYDTRGRLLKQSLFEGSQISIAELPKGMLIIEVRTEKHIVRKKLLHQ